MENCFGALLLASSIYGGYGATLLRIKNNILGCIFALIFYYICEKLLNSEKYQNYVNENA